MIKNSICVLVVLLAGALLLQAQGQEKKYNLQRAYIYQEETLLISDTDLNCSYFFRNGKFPDEIRIIGSEQMDSKRIGYSDLDKLFINRGSQEGFKEGDKLLILTEGHIFRGPQKGQASLGRYYLKKSLAVITCIYDHQAVITLQEGCNPVYQGDIVVPYKPEEKIYQKKPAYNECRIPARGATGNIVYNDLYIDIQKNLAGDFNYVTVNLGTDQVRRGTFLLLYRILQPGLPPIIIGMGIVVNPESNNSTVKILDSAREIKVGDYAVVLPEVKVAPPPVEVAPPPEVVQETAPVVAPPKEVEKKEANLMMEMLFEIGSKDVAQAYTADFAKIADFVKDKSEYAVILRGYCCSIGADEYNLKLSQERTEAVKAILVDQYKIDPARIEAYYYGEKGSPYDNSLESERRRNRLVRIEVVGK